MATYVTLLQGQFGVFFKVAPPSDAPRATKAARKPVPVKFNKGGFEFNFEDSKQARELARWLLDAARAAEFEADLADAKAAKSEAK
jgi:hypothetical protein